MTMIPAVFRIEQDILDALKAAAAASEQDTSTYLRTILVREFGSVPTNHTETASGRHAKGTRHDALRAQFSQAESWPDLRFRLAVHGCHLRRRETGLAVFDDESGDQMGWIIEFDAPYPILATRFGAPYPGMA